MAQAGYTPIQIYYSTTTTNVPSAGNLASGELAINITDGKLFYKDNGGTVRVIAGTGGTGVVAGSNTQVQFNNNGVFGASSGLTWDGTTLVASNLTDSSLTSGRVTYATTGGNLTDSANLLFDGTSLTLGGNPTLSAGTANGIAYLNGSKVVTTGSALSFDGSTLNVNQALNVTDGTDTLRSVVASGVGFFGSSTNVPVAFRINNLEQMRLTSVGLGIGTSSPSDKLHVVGLARINTGTYAAGYGLTFQANSETSRTYQLGMVTDGNFAIYDSAAAAQRVVLDSAGNLGLGVTPSASWASGTRVFQFGIFSAVNENFGGYPEISFNSTQTGSTSFVYRVGTNPATRFSQTDGAFQWYTAPSGTAGNAISFTQAMTLDASGNWMNGTTTAIGRATVVGGSTSQLAFHDGNGSNTNYGYLNYGGSSGELTLNANSTGGNTLIRFLTSNSGTNTERARITSGGYAKFSNNGVYASAAGGFSEFYQTNNSDTLRLTSTSSAVSGAYGLYVDLTTDPNSTDSYFAACFGGANQRATIRANGGFANYQANDVNLSDRREKTNFAPAKSYLDTICAIPVQTFNYIDQSEDDPGLTLGAVAQDVQAVAPELVHESDWGTKEEPKMRLSIYQTDLQYALMKCIQELKAQNDDLRARVAALESA